MAETLIVQCREALEACRSVIQTNIDFMRKDGFEPNPWDAEARVLADEALDAIWRQAHTSAEDIHRSKGAA